MFRAEWQVSGSVVQIRDLKTKDGTRVFRTVVKVATLGMTAEISLPDGPSGDKYRPLLFEGALVSASGTFDVYNGSVQLLGRTFAAYSPVAAVAVAPAVKP